MKQWVKPVKYSQYQPDEFQIFGIDPDLIRDCKNLKFHLVKRNDGKRIWYIHRSYEKAKEPSTYLEEVVINSFILYWRNHYVKVIEGRSNAFNELIHYEIGNEVL